MRIGRLLGSHNIRGIQMATLENEFELYLSDLHSKNVDVLGLSETNVNWKDFQVKANITNNFKQIYIRYFLIGSSSNEEVRHEHKPGGAALLLNSK